MIDWKKVSEIEDRLGLRMTEEQKDTFISIVTNHRNHLVIGKPGVGKSVLIDVLHQYLGNKIVCGSTTGISNQNLFNGRGGVGSMHRIFTLPIKIFNDYDRRTVSSFTSTLFNQNYELEYVLIDEAGFLLNSDLLQLIQLRLKRFNKKYRDRPRRDIKIILVGDLAQLPVFFNRYDAEYMHASYGSPYFFMSYVFEEMNFMIHNLKQVNRTKDKIFMAALDVMRYGINRKYPALCKWINSVMYKPEIPPGLPVMACRNDEVYEINKEMLDNNPNPEFWYDAEIEGDYNTKNCPADTELCLKEGARVMTLVNDLEQDDYSNGSLGIVTLCTTEGVYVKMDHSGKEVLVKPQEFTQQDPEVVGHTITKDGRQIPKLEYKTTGKCKTLPIALAYALSIHKCQGATINSPCVVDLGRDGFNSERFGPALAYVALSRFTDPNLVYLRYPMAPRHIWVVRKIINWLVSKLD